MKFTTATATDSEPGPLTTVVLKYCEVLERCARETSENSANWEPVKAFIAVDQFKRVGAYLEEMSWHEYVRFLTDWVGDGATRFEMTVFQISEVGRTVFQEIEERHYRDDEFIKKNVIAVYRFTDDNRIRHLDIYEQARDSGGWIKAAAQASVADTEG